MVTNASSETLRAALARVNEKYAQNITFRDVKQISKNRIQFTLRSVNSRASGAGMSYSGRRMPTACWHAHGDFFEALFAVDPLAWVRSRGRMINVEHGNWEDRNVGSQIHPLAHSESCGCGQDEVDYTEHRKQRREIFDNPFGRI